MKKLIDKMQKLGLSPKKELIIFGIIYFAIVGAITTAVILTKNYVYAGIAGVFAIVFPLLYFSRYGAKLDIVNNKGVEEFATLFGYFRIYIRNGFSVYSSLKEIVLFSTPEMREMLNTLIKEIDEDKTVQPFVKFAKNFNEIIIEEMMISIYQMIDDGEQSDYLGQFELIFDKFSETIYQKNLKKKDSKLGTLTSAPLLGSCFLIIVLTIGIVNVIGVMINGI